MRVDKTGKIYYHQKGRSNTNYRNDGNLYFYWDQAERRRKSISREEMCRLRETLPLECQEALLDIKRNGGNLTRYEQERLLLLTSLSISLWGGGPKGMMPCVHINEYVSEFYIQMVRFLTFEGKSRFDPNKASWSTYVRFIKYATMNVLAKEWEKLKPLIVSMSVYDIDEIANFDWETIEEKLRDVFDRMDEPEETEKTVTGEPVAV